MIDLLENEKFAAPEIVQALQGKVYTLPTYSIIVHDQYSILFYILIIRKLIFYFKMSNTFSPLLYVPDTHQIKADEAH